MSQRPTERKRSTRREEVRVVNIFQAIRPTSWSTTHFHFPSLSSTAGTSFLLNVGDIRHCLFIDKCMRACLPARPLSHFYAHMPLALPCFFPLHSCKCTLLTHFFKETKKKTKHWITVRQWAKGGHHGNKLRGCMWDRLVSEVVILGKGGGCYRSSCCIWLVNTEDAGVSLKHSQSGTGLKLYPRISWMMETLMYLRPIRLVFSPFIVTLLLTIATFLLFCALQPSWVALPLALRGASSCLSVPCHLSLSPALLLFFFFLPLPSHSSVSTACVCLSPKKEQGRTQWSDGVEAKQHQQIRQRRWLWQTHTKAGIKQHFPLIVFFIVQSLLPINFLTSVKLASTWPFTPCRNTKRARQKANYNEKDAANNKSIITTRPPSGNIVRILYILN